MIIYGKHNCSNSSYTPVLTVPRQDTDNTDDIKHAITSDTHSLYEGIYSGATFQNTVLTVP